MAPPDPISPGSRPPFLNDPFFARYRESVAARESILHHTTVHAQQVQVEFLGVIHGDYRFRETVVSSEPGVSFTKTNAWSYEGLRWLRHAPDLSGAEAICYAGAGIAAVGIAGWVAVEGGIVTLAAKTPEAVAALQKTMIAYWTQKRIITAVTAGGVNVVVGEAVSPLFGHTPDARESVLNFGFGAATGLVFPLPELGLLEAVANRQWVPYFLQSLQRGATLHGPMGATWSVANLATHPEQDSGPAGIASHALSGFVAGAALGPAVDNLLYGIGATTRNFIEIGPPRVAVKVTSGKTTGRQPPQTEPEGVPPKGIYFMKSPPSEFFSREVEVDFDLLLRLCEEHGADGTIKGMLETFRSIESGKKIAVRVDMARDGTLSFYLPNFSQRTIHLPTREYRAWREFFEEHTGIEFPRAESGVAETVPPVAAERDTVPFQPGEPATPPFTRPETAEHPSLREPPDFPPGTTAVVPRTAFPAFDATPRDVRTLVTNQNRPIGKALDLLKGDPPESLLAFDSLLEQAIKTGEDQYAKLPNGWSVQITRTPASDPISAPPGQSAELQPVLHFQFFMED
ncbi:MAG: hypothetical protein HYS22_02825 [Deltaproteobacteria bacterium]|nr:hypothetical protein [Deltaproteobacteria bacterium]